MLYHLKKPIQISNLYRDHELFKLVLMITFI